MADPKFSVRSIKFNCVDESGNDRLGSDEPYWVFTANSGGNVTTSRSKVFGNVDSGDSFRFKVGADRTENVIWPSKGEVGGAPGPIALSIQLWESDQGDAEEVRKKTELAFKIAAVTPLAWANAAPSVVRDQIIKLVSDDMMGSVTIHFGVARLNALLKKRGDAFTHKVRLGGTGGDLPFEIAGGPDYDLFLEVERTA